MLPVTTTKDRVQLKAHALELLKQERNTYESLVILINELQDTNFELPVQFKKNQALRWASGQGYLEVVKYLVEHGANIDVNNSYPLRWASFRGHFEVVKYLVEQGANTQANNEEALEWALQRGHTKIAEYLKEV